MTIFIVIKTFNANFFNCYSQKLSLVTKVSLCRYTTFRHTLRLHTLSLCQYTTFRHRLRLHTFFLCRYTTFRHSIWSKCVGQIPFRAIHNDLYIVVVLVIWTQLLFQLCNVLTNGHVPVELGDYIYMTKHTPKYNWCHQINEVRV